MLPSLQRAAGTARCALQSSKWCEQCLLCCRCAAGDINAITVGDKTNIQDNVVVHVARHSLTSAPAGGPKPTVIGSAVTIGHGATLHACTIGDGCLVRGDAV
jgi:carbonic anhydrase/acetyltransferase-like protein (isoleucine patch superfamily)